MKNKPTLYEISPLMQEVLQNGGSLHLQPMGRSMLPFIREKKDEVILSPVSFPIRTGIIYFYKRNNDALVLHRCIKVLPDGIVFRGDNQIHKESGIKNEQLIGEVTCVIKNGKKIEPGDLVYRFYRWLAFPLCFITKSVIKVLRMAYKFAHKIKSLFIFKNI